MFTEILTAAGAKITVIVGPTGVGKTAFAIDLARLISGEIISVDSRQIYKGFVIGTAQPTAGELAVVPHHLVNVFPVEKIISAGDYVELVSEKAALIREKGRRPVLTGGTLMYISAICHGIIDSKADFEGIRNEISARMIREGSELLFRELAEFDPAYAEQIHPNDAKRIARAHEIYRQSGKAPTQVFKEQELQDKAIRSNYFVIALQRDRQELYDRINDRVDRMLENGWLEEVDILLKSGIEENQHAMQSVGYHQLVMVLKGELSLDAATEIIKNKTRQFAKRQLTWLRKMDIDFTVALPC